MAQESLAATLRRAALRTFVDTNILVRHLTGTRPNSLLAPRGSSRAPDEPLLTDLVVTETIYVLRSFYEVERRTVAEPARAVLAFGRASRGRGPSGASH
jgi:predicted nucleic acid-binding protein